ncbi:MAG: fasciclin domain-containing protein [Alphaproteobacteria bacterium]|nr:fasciclin domain-containing protein [Alphaproteobacteria bacterium]
MSFRTLLSTSLAALAFAACSDNTELARDTPAAPVDMATVDPVAEPYEPTPPAADPNAPTAGTSNQTIAEVAMADGKFTTLLSAARAAGLEDDLSAAGPITVFAPTDAAFDALPAGTLDNLMKPENKAQLEALLQHHIVAGSVSSADLMTVATAQTLNGDLTVGKTAGNGVMVADANVVGADIQTSNGVIHVVDKVLIPAT